MSALQRQLYTTGQRNLVGAPYCVQNTSALGHCVQGAGNPVFLANQDRVKTSSEGRRLALVNRYGQRVEPYNPSVRAVLCQLGL